MVEMYVKVEFEMTKNNVKIFDEWVKSKPEKMKATVLSKDQIQQE